VIAPGEFYNLDEAGLKHMLIPAPARGVILRFIKFYRKKMLKRRKSKEVSQPRSRF